MASICNINECNNKHLAKGFCQKHYSRYKRGNDVEAKTRFDRRPSRIVGDVAYIELANGKGEVQIDKDFSHLNAHNWSLSGDGYPMTYVKGKLIKIHHMVLGKPEKGLVTDHINRDKLDNRKSNLRFVTQRENLLNSTISTQWRTA